MNSEVPSPKDLGNASLSVAGVAQSPSPSRHYSCS